ncbi:restriction endonuclease subunit S [Escherichia coli]|nr:restriction endonuclease subunit S [Escherichia coli]
MKLKPGWRHVKLSDIAKIKSGSTPLRAEGERYFSTAGTPWVKTLDLNNGEIISTDEKITDTALLETSCSVFPVGTVLVAMYGGFNQIGRTGLLTIPAAINQALSGLILDRDKAEPAYILNYLNGNVKLWKKFAASSRKDPNITRDDVCGFPVLLPPLAEQKKIAEILSTWDKAISVTEKCLTNSKRQKKALMQQLLTGKKRLLDENGVRFSGDWGKFTLSHFGKCIRGVSYKPENICENESDNTIRLLRSTNIQNGELNDKDLIILPKKLVKPMQVLMDGDLAICMANGSKSLVGKSAPYKPNDADYTVGAFCALFRPLKSVSSSFVKFLFESNQYQSQLLVILAGSSINNLKGSDIESINIDAPLHYKEQQKIAAVLSAADAEISTLEKKLACLKDEKKALMQQLLTGKRRVSVPVKVKEKEAVSA